MKYMLLIMCLVITPVYAGKDHYKPPEPTPINVPDDGSNHNALLLGVAILAGVCIYHRCWEPKPVKAEAGITPEVPKNEYTYTIKP